MPPSIAPTAILRRLAPHPRPRPAAAFSLVELCVVVFIIGLLAALALPTMKGVALKARVAAVANDLRTFTTALQTYNLQNGKWPADTTPRTMPPVMVGALPSSFTRKTPIGGYYDWDQNVSPNGFLTKSAITLITQGTDRVSSDTALLTAIDKLLDDGNLKTGNVRRGSTNALVYIIEL
jgi:type II secretory pathway pseudopilin PulG